MNNRKETSVHKQDCCDNAGDDDNLLKACDTKEKEVYRVVAEIGFEAA